MGRGSDWGRWALRAAFAGWLLSGFTGGAPPAAAAVYTTGCASESACTLEELLLGGTITAGGQRFASFAIEDDPGVMNWGAVVVTGRDDMGLSPGPGLAFAHNGEAATNGTDSLDVQFSYTVTPVIPAWQPVANDLLLGNHNLAGTGRFEIDETLFDAGRRAIGDKTVAGDDAFDETRFDDAIGFPPQAGGLVVSNTLEIEGQDPGDYADLEDYVQRFSLQVVPEPGFVPAIASSAALLSMLGSRRPRARAIPVAYRRRASDIPTSNGERTR